jgi:hypothetical protein
VTDLSTQALEAWPAFMAELRARLEQGKATYGDRSFMRPPVELLGELEQEALDITGWGFVLWYRLRLLRQRAEGVGIEP